MDYQDVEDELENWYQETCDIVIDENDDDFDITEHDFNFFTEKYEHAFIVRYGSKPGDFPTIGNGGLLDPHQMFLIQSGEVMNRETGLIGCDLDAKTPIDDEKLTHMYFYPRLEKLFKDNTEDGKVAEWMLSHKNKDGSKTIYEFNIKKYNIHKKQVDDLNNYHLPDKPSDKPKRKGVVTRTVTPYECPWLKETIKKGTPIEEFTGVDYGVTTPSGVSVHINGAEYGCELPKNAVKWNE